MERDWVERAFKEKINQRASLFIFGKNEKIEANPAKSNLKILQPSEKNDSLLRRFKPHPGTKLEKVRFPETYFTDNADEYYEKVWSAIDGAEKHIWIIMYHFDDTSIGTITLYKLIEAAKRGVKVCAMHDTLTCKLHKGMMETLRENNGIVHRLNEMYRFWKMPGRTYFKRDHEKLIIADEKLLLGSANISEDYASEKSLI